MSETRFPLVLSRETPLVDKKKYVGLSMVCGGTGPKLQLVAIDASWTLASFQNSFPSLHGVSAVRTKTENVTGHGVRREDPVRKVNHMHKGVQCMTEVTLLQKNVRLVGFSVRTRTILRQKRRAHGAMRRRRPPYQSPIF